MREEDRKEQRAGDEPSESSAVAITRASRQPCEHGCGAARTASGAQLYLAQCSSR